MDYTNRFNNYQFRSPVYLDEHFDPFKFDLVKWEEHLPLEVTDLKTGEKKITTENCYSIGMLIWDFDEEDFIFESCGLRFLENCSESLSNWILAFAEMKKIELKNREGLEE